MKLRLNRVADCLRGLTLLACVVAISPLPSMGLGLRAVAEGESEEAPVESEGFPHGVALSFAENGIDVRQARGRRRIYSSSASLIAAENGHHRSANHGPHSTSGCECFLLPLRC
jgi:hypothetical protein